MFDIALPEFRKLTSEQNVEYLNERVEIITVFSFGVGDQKKCVPRKMKWHNRLIEFSELGFRHPTTKGNRMVHIFDMRAPGAHYRIEFDAENLTWTLISSLATDD